MLWIPLNNMRPELEFAQLQRRYNIGGWAKRRRWCGKHRSKLMVNGKKRTLVVKRDNIFPKSPQIRALFQTGRCLFETQIYVISAGKSGIPRQGRSFVGFRSRRKVLRLRAVAAPGSRPPASESKARHWQVGTKTASSVEWLFQWLSAAYFSI